MYKWFSSMKFRYKILIGMAFITTLALILVTYFAYQQSYQRNMQDARSKAVQSVNAVCRSTDSELHSLILESSQFLLTQPLNGMLPQVFQRREIDYSSSYSSYGQQFDNLVQSSTSLLGAFIYAQNGTFLSTQSAGIRQNPSAMFPEGLWGIKKVTVLTCRSDIMTNMGDVLPIVMPLSGDGSSLTFADSPSSQPTRLVMLVDAEQIRKSISYCTGSYTSALYWADNSGTPLTLHRTDCAEAFSDAVQSCVKNAGSLHEDTINTGSDTLFLTVNPLPSYGIKIVHIFRSSNLLKSENELRTSFFIAWLICLFICGILCVLLSNFLIHPLLSLTSVVSQIKSGTYKNKKQFKYQDEIGVLGNQINNMYDTIQTQIQQIKTEEQEKAHAEIRMLSEQINPHFLYNTLECIHFQVLNGHTQNASAMLESLGKYLRLTLSSGDSMVSVQQEFTHVTEYIALMNRHSEGGIELHCSADPDLMKHLIVKMILQPLAENCIKHGFAKSSATDPEIFPEINITVRHVPNQILITVEDNGKGINLEKAAACISLDNHSGKQHFGLNNIYRRLCSCYGEEAVSITFASIPYFKNTVTILFPDKTNFLCK